MKRLHQIGCLMFCAIPLLCTGCGFGNPNPGNMPYEPDTPAPAAHDGLFVSEHGTLRFNGDGSGIETDLDEELSALTGLPEGEQKGTYVFLSGELPPNGSIPVRYDTAHELQIDIGAQSAVISIGIASGDGKTASVGVDIVTPERIPMLFRDGVRFFHVIFLKADSEAQPGEQNE